MDKIKLLTVKEVSEIFQVAQNTVKTWVHRKIIPNNVLFKLPGTSKGIIRFRETELLEWIKNTYPEVA